MLHAAVADLAEDRVELVLGHQERVVLGVDFLAVRHLRVVEADVVGDSHHQEMSERLRVRQVEQLGQKSRRFLLVLRGDDGVVQLDAHVAPVNQFRLTGQKVNDESMIDVKDLTGDRVFLRAPLIEDAAELFASVASDPEVTRYMSWTPHPDVDETRRVITELFNVGEEHTWLIELRDTGEIIGTCGFRPLQAHNRDFGYVLGRRWWGRRLMPEVVQLLLAEMEI